jgi:sugar phosphate isomerase/epimerase
VHLADRADELGIKLCVEHFPGTALPTVATTLGLLRAISHPNLYLLFDIGHAQISKEDPAAAIQAAGAQLGYVHLDDNDGVGDLHLGLTDGVLTEGVLQAALAALVNIGYGGEVSLELNPELEDPLTALKKSREITLAALSHL